jgi:hypothetical protein
MDKISKSRQRSVMCLLFKDNVRHFSSNTIYSQLKKKLGRVDVLGDAAERNLFFVLGDYKIDKTGEKQSPFKLIMEGPTKVERLKGDDFSRSQFWRTPNGVDILRSAKWQLMIADLESYGFPQKVRANILSDWLEINLDIFSECIAVYFESSQNVMTAQALKENPYKDHYRIFHGPVNTRVSNDGVNMLVDTLGLDVFHAPDVQVRFKNKEFDSKQIMSFAYKTAMTQFDSFENDVPGGNFEAVPGLDQNGNISDAIHWKSFYEMSHLSPKRPVLNVNAGELAWK